MTRMDINEPKYDVPDDIRNQVAVTSIDRIYNWGRRNSIWPMMFGLACCAIEMICTAASRYDLARFGMEVMRPSPRQSDLMIVSGTVTKKMIPQIVRLYNQMPEPKYVLSMGACASGGGPFKEGYNVVSGVDKYIPVDVYVPGCPPTPQALLHGLITLQRKIDAQSLGSVRWYDSKEPFEAIPIPVLGPDIMDPREYARIKEYAAEKLAGQKAAAAEAIAAEVAAAEAAEAAAAAEAATAETAAPEAAAQTAAAEATATEATAPEAAAQTTPAEAAEAETAAPEATAPDAAAETAAAEATAPEATAPDAAAETAAAEAEATEATAPDAAAETAAAEAEATEATAAESPAQTAPAAVNGEAPAGETGREA